MKKFLTFIVIALTILAGLSVSVQAVNANEVGNAEELINAVAEGGKVKLSANITLETTISITKEVEIDLNGFSITPASTLKFKGGLVIVQNGGTLTINDSVGTGKISGGTDSDNLYAAVQVTKNNANAEKTETLIINGGTIEGYYYGIAGNGTCHNTSITINNGNIKGVKGPGIYHPQNGNMTINGGKIEGVTGIEIRAGKLIVNNGTIIGTDKPTSTLPNGSGTTTEGAGIAVAQHTTKLDTNVVINGGNIQGYSALYQSNPQNNDQIYVDKVSIEVNGGNFETINGGTAVVYSENKTGFIKGGTFNTDVAADYVAANLETVTDEDGTVYVGELHTIKVENAENCTVTLSKEEAIAGQKVVVTVMPKDGYKLKSISGVDGLVDIAEYSYEFTMPENNVTILVETEEVKTEQPVEDEDKTEEVKDEKDETPKTGSVDIVLCASCLVAIVSLAGIVTVKKYIK